MKIVIVGTGCPKCNATEKVVRQVVDELGSDVEIVKTEYLQEIVDKGIITAPVVIIDDEVKIVGYVPTMDEIKKLLQRKYE